MKNENEMIKFASFYVSYVKSNHWEFVKKWDHCHRKCATCFTQSTFVARTIALFFGNPFIGRRRYTRKTTCNAHTHTHTYGRLWDALLVQTKSNEILDENHPKSICACLLERKKLNACYFKYLTGNKHWQCAFAFLSLLFHIPYSSTSVLPLLETVRPTTTLLRRRDFCAKHQIWTKLCCRSSVH